MKDSQDALVKEYTVPISYGPKRHYITKLKEEAERQGTNVNITLPRLSFAFTNIQYDTTRQKNPTRYQTSPGATSDVRYKMTSPAPYIITYELSIWAKNTNTGLEVIEQILPFFQPNVSVTMNDTEVITNKKDINFTLTGVDVPIDYEDEIGNDRLLQWNLTFDAAVYIYPPVKTEKVIKSSIAKVHNPDPEYQMGSLTFSVNPPTATVDDVYTIDELIDMG